MSQVFGAVTDDAVSKARNQGRRLSEAVKDVVPSGEDSIQLRMKRAEDAAERAREAEERAVQAAQEAKECSDYALDVTQRGHARVKEVNRDTQRQLELPARAASPPTHRGHPMIGNLVLTGAVFAARFVDVI